MTVVVATNSARSLRPPEPPLPNRTREGDGAAAEALEEVQFPLVAREPRELRDDRVARRVDGWAAVGAAGVGRGRGELRAGCQESVVRTGAGG